MKYVILRRGKPERRALPTADTAETPTKALPVIPTIEVGDLQHHRAANLARKRDVMAVAPVIPLKLIEPADGPTSSIPDPDGLTWGVEAVGASTSPFTGNGVVAAVLDTGIDATHAAFTGVDLVLKNFTADVDHDTNGHGTHCAGTIFGRDVDGIRIGVARGVRKALIGKVLGKGGGGSDQIVQAIQWAVSSGANIISMSLGIDFPGFVKLLEDDDVPTELATSMALEGYRANILLFERLASFIAAQNAFAQTTILVAAAGNESKRHLDPDFKIAVSPPAVADGIVSVAALDRSPAGFVVGSFSNTGARVSGPGVGVRSAQLGGGLTSKNGTSMATPHVVGVAALWAEKLAASGQLSGKLLLDRLSGTALTTGMAPGFDSNDIGAGLVQAPQA